MIYRLLLLNSLLFLFFDSKAQKISKDSLQLLVRNYDTLLQTEDYDYSQRTIIKEDNQYKVEERFKDGKVAATIITSEFPLGEKLVSIQSEALFYPNGNRKKSMRIVSDREVYTEYFNNGRVYQQYLYNLGEKVLIKLYDINGNVLVKDGIGQALYMTEDTSELKFIETGELKDGLPIGEWVGYYASGSLYYKENYMKNGKISGISYDEQGNEYKYDKKEESATFLKGGEQALRSFLAKSLNMNKVNPGKVYIGFLIDTSGKVYGAKALNLADKYLTEEALRVINNSDGKWKGAEKRGIPVKSFFTIPITFSGFN